MTFREVLNSWEELSVVGRFSFLLRSPFMKQEHPEDNEEFMGALDRYGNAGFGDLPWQLQDEFQVYVETDFYRKHFGPKGGKGDGGKIGDGG
jgi:hypothetical protein